MTERERLIELLIQGELNADKKGFFNCSQSKQKAEIIVDYLIENGVIVPPCKVGDTIYVSMCKQVFPFNVTSINTDEVGTIIKAMHGLRLLYMFYSEDIGKTVFLTREEAEKALKEREENGTAQIQPDSDCGKE